MIVNILSEELPGTLDVCCVTYDRVINYITFEDMDGKPYMTKPDNVQAILIPKNTFLDDDSLNAIREIFIVQQQLKHEGQHVFKFNVEA